MNCKSFTRKHNTAVYSAQDLLPLRLICDSGVLSGQQCLMNKQILHINQMWPKIVQPGLLTGCKAQRKHCSPSTEIHSCRYKGSLHWVFVTSSMLVSFYHYWYYKFLLVFSKQSSSRCSFQWVKSTLQSQSSKSDGLVYEVHINESCVFCLPRHEEFGAHLLH